MELFTVDLKKEYEFLQGGKLDCLLMSDPWLVDKGWKRPAVVVVPGGAYAITSKREGEPIASAFWAKGFQVFILWYLVADDGVRYPEQLLELSSAVDYVKRHADEFRVNKDEVFSVGFSAGGHLTADLAVEHPVASELAGVPLDCRPTAVGLSYPVISEKYGHVSSYNNLLRGYSDEEKQEYKKKLNLDEAVDENTAPAFIWSTAGDEVVPAKNAISFALALAERKIGYELHVYPEGQHGLSTGSYEVNDIVPEKEKITRWVEDCAAFFRRYIVEKF